MFTSILSSLMNILLINQSYKNNWMMNLRTSYINKYGLWGPTMFYFSVLKFEQKYLYKNEVKKKLKQIYWILLFQPWWSDCCRPFHIGGRVSSGIFHPLKNVVPPCRFEWKWEGICIVIAPAHIFFMFSLPPGI